MRSAQEELILGLGLAFPTDLSTGGDMLDDISVAGTVSPSLTTTRHTRRRRVNGGKHREKRSCQVKVRPLRGTMKRRRRARAGPRCTCTL